MINKMTALNTLVPLLCALLCANAMPNGAPSSACDTLVPGHSSPTAIAIDPAIDPPDFFLYSTLVDDGGMYIAGESYTGINAWFTGIANYWSFAVTLATFHSRIFQGFLIQAQDDAGNTIGSFTSTDTNVQVLNCQQSSDDSSVSCKTSDTSRLMHQ